MGSTMVYIHPIPYMVPENEYYKRSRERWGEGWGVCYVGRGNDIKREGELLGRMIGRGREWHTYIGKEKKKEEERGEGDRNGREGERVKSENGCFCACLTYL